MRTRSRLPLISCHCLPIALVLILSRTFALASGLEPTLTGTWYFEQPPEEGRKPILIWKIRPEGKLVMAFGTVEKGMLATNPERFGVSSPDNPSELFHGLYKISGADAFSTNSTDKPG